jgi:hypothetical protein
MIRVFGWLVLLSHGHASKDAAAHGPARTSAQVGRVFGGQVMAG